MLTKGALREMCVTKLKLAAVVWAVAGVGLGAGLTQGRVLPEKIVSGGSARATPGKAKDPKKAKQAARPEAHAE